MADPAPADVIGAVEGDSMPGERAIGRDEVANTLAGFGGGRSGRRLSVHREIGGVRACEARDCARGYERHDQCFHDLTTPFEMLIDRRDDTSIYPSIYS